MPREVLRPYVVAAGASVLALVLTLLLWPELEPTPSPFFFAAVVYSGWYGGLGPALLATTCATAVTAWYVPPDNSLAIESASDAIRLGLFALVALLTSSLHRARRRAESERGQHAALAGLGRLALEGNDPSALFREAVARTALALGCERVTVRENADDGTLVRHAQVSCRHGVLEHGGSHAAPLPDDPGPATTRVVLQGADRPLGLLTVTARTRPLVADDHDFLEAVAHVLAEAVARYRAEQERSRLLAAERTARTHAEAANRARQDLLTVVCHELRAPLQSLVTWSRVLRDAPPDPATTSRALHAMEGSADTLQRLTADLLDESRLATGKLELRRRRLLLAEPVGEALELMQAAADAKHIQIACRIDPEPIPVLGDAMRLQQVVWNLVGNALKFTPEGGRIVVAVHHVGEAAELTVSDTGPGIPAPLLPHVFEPFWQARADDRRGLGLGLAIVRDLVELHGGGVRVESPGAGGGSTFHVSLPLLDGAIDCPSMAPVGGLRG